MSQMSDLDDVLRRTRLLTDDHLYAFIRLPNSEFSATLTALSDLSAPFSVFIFDQHETTVVCPADGWLHVVDCCPSAVREGTDFRLITFDLVLPPTLIGYMARISAVLAAAQVPIFPFAAFSRDHILVPASQFQVAWDALTALTRSEGAGS